MPLTKDEAVREIKESMRRNLELVSLASDRVAVILELRDELLRMTERRTSTTARINVTEVNQSREKDKLR
jgi:hypothetical protein